MVKPVITLEVSEAEDLLEGIHNYQNIQDNWQVIPDNFEDIKRKLQEQIKLSKGDLN